MDDSPPRHTPADARPTPMHSKTFMPNAAAAAFIPSPPIRTTTAKLNVDAAVFFPSASTATAAQAQFDDAQRRFHENVPLPQRIRRRRCWR